MGSNPWRSALLSTLRWSRLSVTGAALIFGQSDVQRRKAFRGIPGGGIVRRRTRTADRPLSSHAASPLSFTSLSCRCCPVTQAAPRRTGGGPINLSDADTNPLQRQKSPKKPDWLLPELKKPEFQPSLPELKKPEFQPPLPELKKPVL